MHDIEKIVSCLEIKPLVVEYVLRLQPAISLLPKYTLIKKECLFWSDQFLHKISCTSPKWGKLS